jgi:Domain of unknown function (DUF5655)
VTPDSATEPPPLWVCPSCGARLVTPNLWHSCGEFSLDALLAGSEPQVQAAAHAYVELLTTLGDVQVIPQRSRLVCVARVRFAGLYPRKRSFLAAFALRRWLDSDRIVKRESYGSRWLGHFVRLGSAEEVDDELRAWLKEAYDTVGLQR